MSKPFRSPGTGGGGSCNNLLLFLLFGLNEKKECSTHQIMCLESVSTCYIAGTSTSGNIKKGVCSFNIFV